MLFHTNFSLFFFIRGMIKSFWLRRFFLPYFISSFAFPSYFICSIIQNGLLAEFSLRGKLFCYISHSNEGYDVIIIISSSTWLRLSFLPICESFCVRKYKNCHCQIVLSTRPPFVILQLYPLLFLVLKGII